MGFENRVLISKKALKELQNIPQHERDLIKDRISKLAFFPLAHLDVQKLRDIETFTVSGWEITGFSLSTKRTRG